MIAKLIWLNRKLNGLFALIAAASLILMMLLIVGNGIVRAVAQPFAGTVEVVSWLAAVTTVFALGNSQMHRVHVSIDLLFVKFSPLVRKMLSIFALVLSGVFFCVLMWELLKYGLHLKSGGNLSETMRVPLYPVVLFVALGFLSLITTIVVQVFEVLSGEDRHDD